MTVWTIGHSTRTAEAFLGLLGEPRIEVLVDVRAFPSSKHVPWTNRDRLAKIVRARGLGYEHVGDLGGFRTPAPGSTNRAIRSRMFRGYADHMATPAFRAALDRLLVLAASRRVAVMCAEAVPWRCHRSYLADAVLARGVRVVHILSPGRVQEHRLSAAARVRGGAVSYPGGARKGLKRPRR
ncbi:MAG: DUF488 domain-containing protein [Methanobacteriota archaeon]